VDAPVTLVVALSGAGKTGWLAEHALHSSGDVVYFDVADNSDTSVAPALVREIFVRALSRRTAE